MHFIFVAVGTNGDILPMLAIAAEMRRRGHRATLIADHGYSEYALASDVEYVALSTKSEHSEVCRDKSLLSTRYMGLFFVRHAVRWNMAIHSFIDRCRFENPIVVAVERPNLWADIAAKAHWGVRVVRAAVDLPVLAEACPPDRLLPPSRVQRHLDARWQAAWNDYLAKTGLGAGWGHLARVYRSRGAQPTRIALWPDWILGGIPIHNLRPFGFMPLPVAVSPPSLFTGSGRSTIVFFAGTDGTTKAWRRHFIETSMRICQELNCCGLMLGQQGTDDPAPTEDFRIIGFIPMATALENAVAVVHHGGIGTAAAAMEYGLPQLIVPRIFGQFSNAEWLRRLDACVVVDQRTYEFRTIFPIVCRMIADQALLRRVKDFSKATEQVGSATERV